jgi:3-isopropylmalate/(R)-2-methylmalate dehydratase small subunit
MDKFNTLTAVAAPMPMQNIDTDKVIPARFLKTIKRSGLGVHLFDPLRFDSEGKERPDFILNQGPYRRAQIIVAHENFGCGSSREHAPWGLQDYGFQAIVAPSFGDIFFNNCTKNGLLPVVLDEEDVRALAHAGEGEIDLEAQEVRFHDREVAFSIDHEVRRRLLEGLDDIAVTLQSEEAIDTYERDRERSGPVTTAL